MARETIFPTTPPREIPGDHQRDPAPDWRHVPQVIWQRGMDVQLGIVPEHRPEAHDDCMFTMSLERVQINRLIAVLRRARDAAYGKDE